MTVSKAWDWSKDDSPYWLEPSEESLYLADRWTGQGRRTLLDLGCGLGRHSILFARRGFAISAADLSSQGVEHLREWARRESLTIETRVADMCSTGYADASFDCLLAYHVISHTDTSGISRIIGELARVTRPGGEIFITLCSKDTASFTCGKYPRIDENTIRKVGGAENGIAHFYVDLDDVERLLRDSFELIRVRHINDCWFGGERQDSRHYFILASRKRES